jgi:hypothetical protein
MLKLYRFSGGPLPDREEMVAERISQRLADAYLLSKSQKYVDDEVKALKKAGVLLPNGFTPLPPLFSEEGEDYLKLLGRN